MRKLIKVLIFSLLAVSCKYSFAESRDSIDWYNKEIVIKGEYLKAILVVEKDFIARITKKSEQQIKKDLTNGKQQDDYFSKIENYNIEVSFGNGKYIIWFTPRLSEEFRGGFGGGAVYTIDSKTFKILETEYSK